MKTKSLLDDLTAAGIEYEIRLPRPGVIMNSGELVDLAKYMKDHAGWAMAIAAVLVAWIRAKSGRKVMVTRTDSSVVTQTEGLSVNEFAEVLKMSKEVIAVEGAKPSKDPPVASPGPAAPEASKARTGKREPLSPRVEGP